MCSKVCPSVTSWSTDSNEPVRIHVVKSEDFDDNVQRCLNETDDVFLRNTSEEEDNCKIDVFPERADLVQSICILSDAKYVELYSRMHGYICSVKGEKISYKDGNSLFKVYHNLERTIGDCSIKFVSTTRKGALLLKGIWLDLVQDGSPQKSAVNMNEVKKMLDSMGIQMSEKAKPIFHILDSMQQAGHLKSVNDNKIGTPLAPHEMMQYISSTASLVSTNRTPANSSSVEEALISRVIDEPCQNCVTKVDSSNEDSSVDGKLITAGLDVRLDEMESRIMNNVENRMNVMENKMLDKMDQLMKVMLLNSHQKQL